jgi:ribosomal protein S18 acetylase RimI-like enzyme
MTKVLVTGANGMLGQDLCPILEDNGYDVVETDVQTLDITNPKMVDEVIGEEKPDFVIHCAAYTNVDKAEEDIDTARLINSKGTENIAKACKKYDAAMVYISTDYVFDGGVNAKRTEPYKPMDKAAPLNNYGLTKWEGEEAVRNNLEKYGLDIPGTAYFDEGLDHLSDCYKTGECGYFVIEEGTGRVVGGIGYAGFPYMNDTAELQKLYLDDSCKGRRLGYELMKHAEEAAAERGYKSVYLETHDNLDIAIHLYEKCGYKEIERPASVVHSTMNRFFLKEF